LIDHLIEAARQGKDVTVVVELRARFDEEANLRFANRLQEAGVQVVYGVVGFKTHAKMLLIVRREQACCVATHLSTGNYHQDHLAHLHRLRPDDREHRHRRGCAPAVPATVRPRHRDQAQVPAQFAVRCTRA
jgi:hypothetical protein